MTEKKPRTHLNAALLAILGLSAESARMVATEIDRLESRVEKLDGVVKRMREELEKCRDFFEVRNPAICTSVKRALAEETE